MSEQPPTFLQQRERQQQRQSARDFFDQRDDVNLNSVWMDRKSRITIFSLNSNALLTFLRIQVRIMRTNGSIDLVDLLHAPTSDRVLSSEEFNVGIGWIVSAFVRPFGTTTKKGECLATLMVTDAKEGLQIQLLFSGYIVGRQFLGYPEGGVKYGVDGTGVPRSVAGTLPAAGANIFESVPTNAMWRLDALTTIFTADANVATRTVIFIIDDGATELFRIPSQNTQTAGQVRLYNSYPAGHQPGVVATTITIPLPAGLILDQGWRIRTSVTNIQVGDQFTAPQLKVMEWIQD